MGKKKSRDKQTSKGERPNSNKKLSAAIRSEYITSSMRPVNQIDAFMRGKNVKVTIANPNPNETNKPFIKVDAKEIWRR